QIRTPSFVSTPPEYPCLLGARFVCPSAQNPCCYVHNSTSFLFAREGSLKMVLCKNSTLGYRCSTGQSPPYFSVQEQLENYIKNQTAQCINFDYLKNITAMDFNNEKANNMSVSVVINDADIDVSASIPFEVAGRITLFREEKYSIKIEARLKNIVRLANELVEKEKTDVTYDITNPKNIQIPTGMLVKKKKDAYLQDDIIIINDTKSNIGGRTLIFQFYVKNRPPALDYFPERKSPNIEFDLLLFTNSVYDIVPTAYDPDEDDQTYLYSGWKEQEIKNSEIYIRGNIGKGDIGNDILPKRAARITTTDADFGKHEFNITVTDNALKDWQRVRVFVDKELLAKAFGYNHYLDLKDRTAASIEDPYTIDASKSSISILEETKYRWDDPLEQSTPLYEGLQATVVLPKEKPDINDMSGVFNKVDKHTMYLTLSSLTISTDTFTIPVYACLAHRSEAAPYPFNNIKGDDYSKEEEDPFQANHACCSDDSKIKKGDVCYKFDEYTCRYNQYELSEPIYPSTEHYFANRQYTTGSPSTGHVQIAQIVNSDDIKTGKIWPATKSLEPRTTLTSGITQNIAVTDQRANDVYIRTYSVKCDGTRGNVCNGAKEEKWEKLSDCTSAQYCTYGKKECQNWRYTPGKPEENYLCNPVLKCSASPINEKSYAFPVLFSANYLIRGVADGRGNCNAAVINYDGSPAYTKRNIYPTGILKMDAQYFLSVDCSYYNGYKLKGNSIRPGENPEPITLQNEKMPSGNELEFACDDGLEEIPSSIIIAGYMEPGKTYYGQIDAYERWLNIKTTRKYTCTGQGCRAEREDIDKNKEACNKCGFEWVGGRCCGDDLGGTALFTNYNKYIIPEFLPGAKYYGSKKDSGFVVGQSACCNDRGMCAVNGICIGQGKYNDNTGEYCCSNTGVAKKPTSGCTALWKKQSCTASGWQCISVWGSIFGGGGGGIPR
ncbi:MAG TPA: hypothetical protein VI894_02980, partial [Candidatus Nanoarchaeia archaeon]|nr:hypothetical protein [Candidatus Nanoarchaeia archaeon]